MSDRAEKRLEALTRYLIGLLEDRAEWDDVAQGIAACIRRGDFEVLDDGRSFKLSAEGKARVERGFAARKAKP